MKVLEREEIHIEDGPGPEKASGVSVRLADYMRQVPVTNAECSCGDALLLFRRHPESECVVVCEADKPVGLLMRNQFYTNLSQRFGAELYYEKPVSRLMDASPIAVDIADPPQQLIDLALNRGEKALYDCVIVTNGGRAAGILTVADLLNMSRQLQKEAVVAQLATTRSVDRVIREIEKAVNDVRLSARDGDRISATMSELAAKGREELSQVTGAFERLAHYSARQESRIGALQQEADSIGSMSELIKQLAEQCNLLAINASIEAARAGEHGRGFSVVADEVRKLANETRLAAEQITRQTGVIADAIAQTAALAQEAGAEAGASGGYVKQAEEAFAALLQASADNRSSAEAIGRLSERAYGQTAEVSGQVKRLLLAMAAGTGDD